MVARTQGSFSQGRGRRRMSETIITTAGIDTAKDKLDIAIHGSREHWQVANDRLGWQELAARLAKCGVERVGIEASGGYERGIVKHLRAAGFTVIVLQPVQVKAYARQHRRRAKNDRLDAVLIAACTAAMTNPPSPPDERLGDLAGPLTFLEQTEEDIARLKVRLEHVEEPRLRRHLLADTKRLKTRQRADMRLILETLRRHEDLARRFDLVVSIPGIGERTALAIVIRMPELGRISREQAAALAGRAPFDDESGRFRGARHIACGRSRLRCSL